MPEVSSIYWLQHCYGYSTDIVAIVAVVAVVSVATVVSVL